MSITLAIAPNGAAAADGTPPGSTAFTLPEYQQDLIDGIHLWAGRQGVETNPELTNTTLSERPQDWRPLDEDTLRDTLRPDRIVKLPLGPETMAQKTADMPVPDGYLLAAAAADRILRNLHNGMTFATFPDGSQAYTMPATREVRSNG